MRVFVFAIAISAVLISIVSAQSTRQGQRSNSEWDTRLEALVPGEPMHYFELAEEIADAADDENDRDLARHLFALSGALEPELLGRSACLALLDLEADEQKKTRLSALASLLMAGSFAPRLGQGLDRIKPGSPAALAAAEALGHYRNGDGQKALKSLEKPGAQELLARYDRLLPGGIARFLEDCKHYKGQLKPTLSHGEVTRMLRLEAALLAVGERSWSSELLLTGGRPLMEVDPTNLQDTFGVDATKPYFRRGRWVEKG